MTIKWFKSPYSWVISPLTLPRVANQQKKNKKKTSFTSYKPQYANTKIVYCADAMTPFVQLPVLPKPKLQESNRRFQNKGSKIKPFH